MQELALPVEAVLTYGPQCISAWGALDAWLWVTVGQRKTFATMRDRVACAEKYPEKN